VYRQLLDAAAELAAGLSAQLEAAREERDTAESVTARAVADVEAMRANVASLTAERDQIDTERADAIGELATACRALTAAEAERNALRAEVAELRARPAGLADAEVESACKNIGYDLSCGACAAIFYTGSAPGYPHECRTRTVLTVDLLDDALHASYSIDGTSDRYRAEWIMSKLGPATLPTPDRAEELIAAYVDEFATRYEAEGNPPHMDRWHEVSADRRRFSIAIMESALAKLTPAPPKVEPAPAVAPGSSDAWLRVGKAMTMAVDREREAILAEMGGANTTGRALPDSASLWPRQWNAAAKAAAEVVAPGALVAVSDEDLAAAFRAAWNQTVGADTVARLAGIRAVRALLGARLIAPVDPEAVARSITETAGWVTAKDPHGRRAVIGSVVRTALTAAGIPVTPEAGK
jgi:hypothetical protein